jgi:hypothetical protein
MFKRKPVAHALGFLGLGAALFGVAVTVHPVHASAGVFWTLVVAAGIAVVAGFVSLRRSDGRSPRPGLLARECRQIAAALMNLLDDCHRSRAAGPFGNGGARRQTEALRRYRHDLRAWATQIFDEAVVVGAISPACRPLLQADSVVQLRALCDRFADAATELERR